MLKQPTIHGIPHLPLLGQVVMSNRQSERPDINLYGMPQPAFTPYAGYQQAGLRTAQPESGIGDDSPLTVSACCGTKSTCRADSGARAWRPCAP
jgi:hypothetical protein